LPEEGRVESVTVTTFGMQEDGVTPKGLLSAIVKASCTYVLTRMVNDHVCIILFSSFSCCFFAFWCFGFYYILIFRVVYFCVFKFSGIVFLIFF
jgi:hypothetical protein